MPRPMTAAAATAHGSMRFVNLGMAGAVVASGARVDVVRVTGGPATAGSPGGRLEKRDSSARATSAAAGRRLGSLANIPNIKESNSTGTNAFSEDGAGGWL